MNKKKINTALEITAIKKDVAYYEQIRAQVKLSSSNYIDLKSYEPAMRHLIDTYIGAEESRKISAFDDLTLIELIVKKGPAAVNELPEGIRRNPEAVAETIENNICRAKCPPTPGSMKICRNCWTN